MVFSGIGFSVNTPHVVTGDALGQPDPQPGTNLSPAGSLISMSAVDALCEMYIAPFVLTRPNDNHDYGTKEVYLASSQDTLDSISGTV